MRYRYREEHEMKDSGVKWIGKIPSDWEISKFKYVSELYTGNSIKDTEKDNYLDEENAYPYIATKDISIDYNTINYRNGMYTKISDKNFRVANTNSILLCIEGGSAGRKISYLNHDVSFVNKLCCIKPNKIQNKFQYYYCNSDSFKKEFSLNISGLIGGVSVNALKNFLIVTPKINEQEKIANFLDEKTSQFNLIISKKEELIQRLEEAKKSLISEVVTGKVKVVNSDNGYDLVNRSSEEMKASGVEWLKEIPSHWKVVNGKWLFNQRKDKAQEDDEQLTASQKYGVIFQKDFMELENQKVVLVQKDFSILKHVEPNDFVISMRSFQGGLEYSKLKGCISSAYVMLIPNEKVHAPFFKWFFKSAKYINALQSTSNLIRDGQAMRYSNFTQIQLFLFSKEEQVQISNYLDSAIGNIEKLINKTNIQIEKLKEAKQSLISEAVTGKIEIID